MGMLMDLPIRVGCRSRTGFDLAVTLAQEENVLPGFNLSTAYCDAGRSDIQSISCASDLVTEYGDNLVGVVGLRFSSGLRGGSLFYNLHQVPVLGHASTGSEHISKEGIENVFRVRSRRSPPLTTPRSHAVQPTAALGGLRPNCTINPNATESGQVEEGRIGKPRGACSPQRCTFKRRG